MGRSGKWLVAVKRVFSPESKEKKAQKKRKKSKKRWGFGKCNNFDPDSSDDAPVPQERRKLPGSENDQSKHAYSVALASAVAAEAAQVAAQAAAEVVRLTKSARFAGRSKEEVAAIKIQTAFRGYMARRALRALRGLVRLKALTNSNAVKCQAAATLRCMQTLARVQAQVRSRRIRMSEENLALQRQLQLKHERELEKLRMSEEWDDSFQSKEQIEAHLQNKQEASIRRERGLAYAFSHQWKASSRSAIPTFLDPNNPEWGWSWMERWMAARPWENLNTTEQGKSPSTPPTKKPSMSRKIRSASPRKGWAHVDSMSVQSERARRHSIGGGSSLSIRDDESLSQSQSQASTAMTVPSYMAPTESAKAKAKHRSSLMNNLDSSSERSSVTSVRKRLSFPSAVPVTVAARRHSVPPRVDVGPLRSNEGKR